MKFSRPQKWSAALLALACLCSSATVGAAQVEVVRDGEGWQLRRDGKPYFVKGAGGTSRLDLLAAAGANSVRTWGADNLGPLLDDAHKQGLAVTVGIWLRHEGDDGKFSYDNPQMLKEQLEVVRQAVLRYKDHPAVLMWGIGNEMEGYADGDRPVIWKHVNEAAKLAKSLDTNHPVMTVIVELGGKRIASINEFCPDVDIVGINSYAGASSIATRYAALKPTKPYIITEFGPPGSWEVGKTSWGAPVEPTSTEKADWYRRAYVGSVQSKPWCLGSYAFLWGNKQEATATWFGMLLPDGTKLNPVDAMTELWSGKPPQALCPSITGLSLAGAASMKPNQTFKVNLTAKDPTGGTLKVRWVIQPEQTKLGIGGKEEPVLPELQSLILASDDQHCEIRAPKEDGGYRVFAYVRNEAGASVGNVPFQVRAKEEAVPPGKAAQLPFCIYENDASANNHYIPSGWMGKTDAMKMELGCKDNPRSAPTCMKFSYSAPGDWGGIVWQDPHDDWGDRDGGWNLAGAKKISFWARGEQGGEVVSFKFGLLGREKAYFDSGSGAAEEITLTKEWKEYAIDLANINLARIKTGFAWSLAGQGRPLTFYLDDIRYE